VAKNLRLSLLAHIGICLVISAWGGFQPYLYKEILFTVIVIFLYSFIGGMLVYQGSKIKNLISVSLVSMSTLVISLVCVGIYQFVVINMYNYKLEPVYYKFTLLAATIFNGSVTPTANLIGRFVPAFMLPYGWLLTFFIPTLALWYGIEWKAKRASNRAKEVKETK